MPQLLYFRRLDDIALLEVLAARAAAEALIGLGWPVAPAGDDMDLWQIGDLVMTDDELIGLATRWGIRSGYNQVQ